MTEILLALHFSKIAGFEASLGRESFAISACTLSLKWKVDVPCSLKPQLE